MIGNNQETPLWTIEDRLQHHLLTPMMPIMLRPLTLPQETSPRSYGATSNPLIKMVIGSSSEALL